MKRVIAMQDLDCANCAAKMEQSIKKIEGVNSVSINFMTQKMTLDVSDDNFDGIITKVKAAIKKIEPDCKLKI